MLWFDAGAFVYIVPPYIRKKLSKSKERNGFAQKSFSAFSNGRLGCHTNYFCLFSKIPCFLAAYLRIGNKLLAHHYKAKTPSDIQILLSPCRYHLLFVLTQQPLVNLTNAITARCLQNNHDSSFRRTVHKQSQNAKPGRL